MASDNGDQDRSGATGGGREAARHPALRFSLALPLGQLVLCAGLIVIVCGPGSLMPIRTGTMYIEVNDTATDHHGGGPYREGKSAQEKDDSQGGGHAEQPPNRQARITGRVLASVWLLNLPGGFLQMEAARYASTHQGRMARGVDGFTTSFLSSSILALPFWWVAGRGAEALVAMRRNVVAPRIRFSEAAIGFVMLSGAVLLAITALMAFITGGDKLGALLIMMFLLLWCFLGGITVRAHYKQRGKLAPGN